MKGGIFDVAGPFMKILVTAYVALVLLAMFFAINQYNLIFIEDSRDTESMVVGNTILSLDCLTESSGGHTVKSLLSEDKINKEIALNPLRDKNINCVDYDKQIYVEIYNEAGFLYYIGDSGVCETKSPCKEKFSTTVTTFPAALNRTSKIVPVNLKIFVGIPTPAVCGNNKREGLEECDCGTTADCTDEGGGDLGGQDCTTRGYIGGTLSCISASQPNECKYDTSKCISVVCGDIGFHCCTPDGCRALHRNDLDPTCGIGEWCCQLGCCPDLNPGDTCPITCQDLCWCPSEGLYKVPGASCT